MLLIGLQACGKTTFYRERLAATHALVSKDAMSRSARRKEDRQRRELAALLADGHDVCVDNTQPSAAERAGVIAVARAHGARVVGYWWPPDLELRCDATRPGPTRCPRSGCTRHSPAGRSPGPTRASTSWSGAEGQSSSRTMSIGAEVGEPSSSPRSWSACRPAATSSSEV